MTNKRRVFFISDGTGITAETLGNSLITQFGDLDFETSTIPYVNTPEKVTQTIAQINTAYQESGHYPLVFTTLINLEIRKQFAQSNSKVFDLFQAFLEPIEKELGAKSSYTVGKSHSIANVEKYHARIEAINYALASDDGLGVQHYDKADVIIVGVSRSGKTPTCLYLALHFGVLAANYPLTEDDFHHHELPKVLKPFRKKLFGLTIDPNHLQKIRHERRPNSPYSSNDQCANEIHLVEKLYQQESIQFLDTTAHSIEEISTRIIAETGIVRRLL